MFVNSAAALSFAALWALVISLAVIRSLFRI